MTDALVTSSSVTGSVCPLASSWSSCFIKNVFGLWDDQRFSLKPCQGYNLSHALHLVLAEAAWIGRRPVLGLWNWELNAVFSWNVSQGLLFRDILVPITRVWFCFPKTSIRQKTVLFRLLPCLKSDTSQMPVLFSDGRSTTRASERDWRVAGKHSAAEQGASSSDSHHRQLHSSGLPGEGKAPEPGAGIVLCQSQFSCNVFS